MTRDRSSLQRRGPPPRGAHRSGPGATVTRSPGGAPTGARREGSGAGDAHLQYLLSAYLFDNISEAGRREVEDHLARCPECRAELEELRATLGLVEGALSRTGGEESEYSFEARRLDRVLAVSRRAPWWRRISRKRLALAAVVLVACALLTLLVTSPVLKGYRSKGEDRFASRALGDAALPASAERSAAVVVAPEADKAVGKDRVRKEATGHRGENLARERRLEREAAPGRLSSDATLDASGVAPQAPRPGAATALPPPEVAATTPPARSAPRPGGEVGGGGGQGLTVGFGAGRRGSMTTHGGIEGSAEQRAKLPRSGAEEARRAGEGGKHEVWADEDAPETITFYGFAADDDSPATSGTPVEMELNGADAPPLEELKKGDLATKQPSQPLGEARGGGVAVLDGDDVSSSMSWNAIAAAKSKSRRHPETPPSGPQPGEKRQVFKNLELPAAAAPGKPRTAGEEVAAGLQANLRTPATRLDRYMKNAPDVQLDVKSIAGDPRREEWSSTFSVEVQNNNSIVLLAEIDGRQSLAWPGGDATEKQLRAFSYYRALDPELDREIFRARALKIPAPVVGDEGLGREGFRARYGVNPFVDTRRDRLSTFAMDVDTASYTRARALLRSMRLPDPATVRVEEFINFFPQPYEADPALPFSVFCEGGPSPFGTGLELLKVTVKARELRANERRDAVLTFAIDVSGSMHLEDRLGLVKAALGRLIGSLAPDDRLAIVAYGATAYLALPHTPARERDRILGALDSLEAGGSTNVEAGLDLAYRLADEVRHGKALNRVILCSDGVATAGARGAEEILEKVKVFASRGIYLSVVGFGRQRYNDAFLEELADRGNGNYAYVDTPAEAERIFNENLPASLQVLARDAKIQVDFNPDTVSHYRLLGYENRDIRDEDFRNDRVDAGEVGPGSTVTALYEIRRRPAAYGPLGRVFLRFHETATGRVEELDFPLTPGVIAGSLDEASDRFRFIACAAELAELLRNSYWARDGSCAQVLDVLGGLSPLTRFRPEWRELTDLVVRAQALTLASLTSQ
ncbi:MAG: von Willebrand factor type A domain-containing protein [Planctomycetota bacterium]